MQVYTTLGTILDSYPLIFLISFINGTKIKILGKCGIIFGSYLLAILAYMKVYESVIMTMIWSIKICLSNIIILCKNIATVMCYIQVGTTCEDVKAKCNNNARQFLRSRRAHVALTSRSNTPTIVDRI